MDDHVPRNYEEIEEQAMHVFSNYTDAQLRAAEQRLGILRTNKPRARARRDGGMENSRELEAARRWAMEEMGKVDLPDLSALERLLENNHGAEAQQRALNRWADRHTLKALRAVNMLVGGYDDEKTKRGYARAIVENLEMIYDDAADVLPPARVLLWDAGLRGLDEDRPAMNAKFYNYVQDQS